jgi:hypothetical protein
VEGGAGSLLLVGSSRGRESLWLLVGWSGVGCWVLGIMGEVVDRFFFETVFSDCTTVIAPCALLLSPSFSLLFLLLLLLFSFSVSPFLLFSSLIYCPSLRGLSLRISQMPILTEFNRAIINHIAYYALCPRPLLLQARKCLVAASIAYLCFFPRGCYPFLVGTPNAVAGRRMG